MPNYSLKRTAATACGILTSFAAVRLAQALGTLFAMNWMPISEAALWDKLNAAESRMSLPQLRLWEAIRVSPEKWKEERYGAPGGGFWAVAILGSLVVWYNDIEDGFNYSKYSCFGVIDEYWCGQDELEHTTQRLLVYVQTGQVTGPHVSPPLAGVHGGA